MINYEILEDRNHTVTSPLCGFSAPRMMHWHNRHSIILDWLAKWSEVVLKLPWNKNMVGNT